jgi:hypothetical protein
MIPVKRNYEMNRMKERGARRWRQLLIYSTHQQLNGRRRWQYLYTTGFFKRRVILKQQFTIEKGYYVNDFTKKYCSTRIYYRAMLFDCSKLLNHT